MKNIMLALVLLSNVSFALTEHGKEIDAVGVQGDNVYFGVKGGLATSCKWGNIYFSHKTDFGKAAYSQLLMVKASGKELSRIDYTQNPDSTCSLGLIEVK